MGSFNPYYTGGDPSYFPAPHRGGKSGLRDLVRFIAGCAIVSLAITVAVMRLFWQAPAAHLTPAPASGLKRTIPDRATFVRMRDGSVVSAYTARPRVRVLPAEPDPDF